MRCGFRVQSVLCLLAVGALSAGAKADLTHILSTFGGTTLTSGSVSLLPTGPGLSVSVDYAVFDAGTWDISKYTPIAAPPGLPGAVAPIASDYLYAYQLVNTSTPATVPVAHSFSADFDGAISSIGFNASVGEVPPAPVATLFPGQFYFFLYPAPVGGQSSPILLLTSPDKFKFQQSSIQSGGHTAIGDIPLPGAVVVVPAPSAALLAMIGVAVVSAIKRPRAIAGLIMNR